MKKSFVSILLAGSLLLCSCSVSESQRENKLSVQSDQATAAIGQSTTVSDQQTSAPTSEDTAASVSDQQTQQQDQPVTADASADNADTQQPQSHGQDFMFYTEDESTGTKIVKSDINAAVADVRLSNTVRIDRIIDGLRDKEAEERARKEKERLEKERIERERREKEQIQKQRLEKERLEKEKLEKERLEKERLQNSMRENELLVKERTQIGSDAKEENYANDQLNVVSGSVNAAPAAYGTEFVAKSLSDFKGFMSYYFVPYTVNKYAQVYNETFFKTKNLLLKVIIKQSGDTTVPQYTTAAGNKSTKTITLDFHSQKLTTPIKKRSSVLMQTAVTKADYNTYGSSKVNWRIDKLPYYPLAIAKLNEVGWDLEKAFKASHSIPYYGHTADMPQDDKHTTEWYAEYGFTKHKGNCYVMSAMFCEMARMLGYECTQISGRVPLTRGGFGAHSWCEIIYNGEMYFCDPNFTNATKVSGYLRHYGEKQTWRYVKDTTVK